MEDKQLNFNQPLLTVRRFSPTVVSQKDEKRKTDNSVPSIPPLPSYKPELKSGPLRDPGSVPFVWEHSPGTPKEETTPHIHAMEGPPTVPKLPPGRILKPKKQEALDIISEETSVTKGSGKDRFGPFGPKGVPSTEEKVSKIESSKETTEKSSDSEDGDDAYMDALDTLSRSESFFYNCSVSGLSGLESDVKTSSTDPKTQDFMMGRFLPAAKAMASEAPQHAPRKQPVVIREQPREVKKMVNRDKWPPLRYGPNFVQDYAHDNNTEEESDDDYDDQGNVSSKVCGLLPRFCLLNPLPGMSVRTRISMSPVNRTRGKSSSGGSCSKTEHHKPARFAIYEHRSLSKFQSTERREERSALKNNPAQSTNQNNFQKLEGSALYNRLQGHAINGEAKDGQAIDFTSQKKGPISFKELLANGSDNREIDSASHMVVKTLYVDIVHKKECPKPNSCSSDVKQQSDFSENFKIIAKSEALGETPSVHFLVKDTGNLRMADDSAKSHSNAQIPVDVNMEIQQTFGKDAKICQDSYTKLSDDVNLDYEAQKPSLEENSKNSQRSFSEFPVPPPLPKSPSDSWLWRALPSVSSKNASLRSYLGTGVHPRNTVSKERNVQATNTQHQHLRFSEGLLIPIPET